MNLATTPPLNRAKRIGMAFIILWFLLGGIAHFVFTDAEVRIGPPSIPSPRNALAPLNWSDGLARTPST